MRHPLPYAWAKSQRLLLEKGDIDIANNLPGDQIAPGTANAYRSAMADRMARIIYADDDLLIGRRRRRQLRALPALRSAMSASAAPTTISSRASTRSSNIPASWAMRFPPRCSIRARAAFPPAHLSW